MQVILVRMCRFGPHEAAAPTAVWTEAFMIQRQLHDTSSADGKPRTVWGWPCFAWEVAYESMADVLKDAEAITRQFARRNRVCDPRDMTPITAGVYGRTCTLVVRGPACALAPGPMPGRPGYRSIHDVCPRFIWALESELASSDSMGDPCVNGIFGVPVCVYAVRAWNDLVPVSVAFASTSPPLALYHGTGWSAATAIVKEGLRASPASAAAMAGPGVYLARWKKAEDFAARDADGAKRTERGVVLRVAVAIPPGGMYTLQSTDICSCSCARPFVDHGGRCPRARGATVVHVSDGSEGAARRAEWCVRDEKRLVVLGAMAI